ncbi:class I SAM-dependent methyltransferase [Undibacterium fentianense]|uniref:Class I SAM-dependent methyltransferase n=1 Tax=Undibacterium fentianense TaxID=2828728 RepID=A0A941E5F3_9BURK|nr:class I SAM-dependent methyltransferase [Undibacterium fentianense]MBR7801487.1 class I SAM-dependent methyltransferase [Undibacterium fentianense]
MTKKDASLSQRVRAIPLLGYCLVWLKALIRLPVTRQQHTFALADLERRIGLQAEDLRRLHERVDALEPLLELVYVQVVEQTNRTVQAAESGLSKRLQQYDMLDLGARVMRLEKKVGSREFRTLLHRASRYSESPDKNKKRVDEAPTELTKMASPEHSLSAETSHAILVNPRPVQSQSPSTFDVDAFYYEFEQAFRGDEYAIAQRQRVYIDYLQDFLTLSKSDRSLFVDLGCGRGEWLSLLKEIGIPALGIDLNADKVQACRAIGLQAEVADALGFLSQQASDSLGGVTAFHLIEHISFESLIALFDSAYRALRPGGILIFETPNPENLITGACNFYYDPSHLKPIVPDVAVFMAKQRGFAKAQIVRLNPFEDHYQLPETDASARVLNQYLFGPRDYALIARK